jgi:hypothetical protein
MLNDNEIFMNEEMPMYRYTTYMKKIMGRPEMFTREELELLMGEKKEEKTIDNSVRFSELPAISIQKAVCHFNFA